jgi:general secretion pathway protein K
MLSAKSQGIALIQVLMLSALLSVMMLSIMLDAKSQINMAALLQNRTEAALKLQSQEAIVSFALLTNERLQNLDSPQLVVKQWNFFDKPIQTPYGELRIQDVASLVSIYDYNFLDYLLRSQGVDKKQAFEIVEQVKINLTPYSEIPDYLSPYLDPSISVAKRQSGLQLIEELKFIPGVSSELYQQIVNKVTTYPSPLINVKDMPEDLMAYYVQEPNLTAAIQMRNAGELEPQTFARITGLDISEGFTAHPSNALRVSFTASVKDVRLARDFVLVVNPLAAEPITFWEYHKYSHGN